MDKIINDFLEDKIDKLKLTLQVKYDEDQYNDEPLRCYISSICGDRKKFDLFCKALETTIKLKSLLIQNAFIPNERQFFNSLSINDSITELEISNSSNIDVKQLCEAIENNNLKILRLNSTKLYNLDYLFEFLKTNTTIKELEITNFNKDQIIYDVNMFELKTLYEALLINKTLTKLNLSYNYIKSIKPLCEVLMINRSLQIIDLSNNMITDIEPLSKVLQYNNKIKKIFLHSNSIKNISPLYKALKINYGLQKIDLSYNNISEINFEIFFNILECNNSLVKINLYQNLCEDYTKLHKEQLDKLKNLSKEKNVKIII